MCNTLHTSIVFWAIGMARTPTRYWKRALAKADYTWRRLGFPHPAGPRYPTLIFKWWAMVRWYYLNPSCFWGDLHENDTSQGWPEDMITEAPHGWVCWNEGPQGWYWSADRASLEHELTDDLRPATGLEALLLNLMGNKFEPGDETAPITLPRRQWNDLMDANNRYQQEARNAELGRLAGRDE